VIRVRNNSPMDVASALIADENRPQ
jgi:hypothetical protein